jgi:ATP-dependent Clp protease adaptor protein ClpS
MSHTETASEVITATRTVMRPPSKFNVILFNDEFTTVEFVVLILMSVFHKSFEDASQLTIQIHQNGQGIAGSYTYEIASQKRNETISAARGNGFPLECEIEEV